MTRDGLEYTTRHHSSMTMESTICLNTTIHHHHHRIAGLLSGGNGPRSSSACSNAYSSTSGATPTNSSMVSKQVDTRSLLQNIIRERFRERREYRVRTLATSHIISLITGAADIDPIILGRGRGRWRPFHFKGKSISISLCPVEVCRATALETGNVALNQRLSSFEIGKR